MVDVKAAAPRNVKTTVDALFVIWIGPSSVAPPAETVRLPVTTVSPPVNVEDAPALIEKLGPAGTPQPIIDKLHKTMAKVLAKEAFKKRLEGVGAIANLSTPAEFKKVIESDIKTFQGVAKTAGLEAK